MTALYRTSAIAAVLLPAGAVRLKPDGPLCRGALTKAIPEGLFFREAVIWRKAVQEAAVEPSAVSPFGRNVGKVPASWVEQVNALNHTKVRDFNFQGSGFERLVAGHRRWVLDFAEEHFGPEDYLRFTDASRENPSYKPLGVFDKTLSDPGGFRPKDHVLTDRWGDMSLDYYRTMAASRFTLCPRGDRAFSYRFYEAALSFSIPVVLSLESDLASTVWVPGAGKSRPQALRCIGYHYYSLESGEPLVYREDWAQENYQLFIKYQTFLQGDNVPVNCTAWPVPPNCAEQPP